MPTTDRLLVTEPLTPDDVGLHDRVPASLLDGALSVQEGVLVLKPKGVPHGFRNVATTRTHVIELTTSDRFVRFLQESAGVRADAALDDDARAAATVAVALRYGMRFDVS